MAPRMILAAALLGSLTSNAVRDLQAVARANGWTYTFLKQSALGEWRWTKTATGETVSVSGWHASGRRWGTVPALSTVFHTKSRSELAETVYEAAYTYGTAGLPQTDAAGLRVAQEDADRYQTTVLPAVVAAAKALLQGGAK